MSVQQNITDFRQTLRDRASELGGVAEPVQVTQEILPISSSSTDVEILNNIVSSFTASPEFTGTASFQNITVSNSLVGNSIVANTITAINVQSNTITANGSVGAASQVLMSGGVGGNLYWSTIASPTITLDATLASGSTSSRTIGVGNTTITGFANVTSTIQGGSSLTIAGAASGITTLAAGNTTITGFANVTSTIQGGAGLTIAGVASFSNTVQTTSFGVGTSPSGTAGEIRATNNITAYYSSDKRFKENVQSVINPLDIVTAIGSKTFNWTDAYIDEHGGEDEYFLQKADFGVIAQDVKRVFPQAVRTRTDGSLAVDYGKLAILSFGAIEQLLARIEQLESNKSS